MRVTTCRVGDQQTLLVQHPLCEFRGTQFLKLIASALRRINAARHAWRMSRFSPQRGRTTFYETVTVDDRFSEERQHLRRTVLAMIKFKQSRCFIDEASCTLAIDECLMRHHFAEERDIRLHATNSKRTKYDLKYYVNLAKELEKMGAHILAIKDMAGLCKPAAASQLVKALKQEIGIPIHFHTHDTAGIQAASILEGSKVGLDIADAAMAPMSGGTSQVNLNTLVEMFRFGDRDTALNSDRLDSIAEYWREARDFYTPFESVSLAATADLYRHEMPGGQYTNLFEQARALGLADRWPEACRIYAEVNQLFGDIVKVTPTSKSVGDMALFMLANNLTCEDVLNPDRDIAFPVGVIDLISGGMGQPPGGFPEAVKKRVLLGKQEFVGRPGETLPPADMDAAKTKVAEMVEGEPTGQDVISWLLYERVYEEFAKHQMTYSDVSILPTPNFFFGLEPGEEISIDIETGKTLIIRFVSVSTPHADGTRTVFFELNGQPREITVTDNSIEASAEASIKADPAIAGQIGSTMPGMVVAVAVKVGEPIKKGQKLLTLEAMKMETTITADLDGKIRNVLVQPGRRVETGDLLVEIEA